MSRNIWLWLTLGIILAGVILLAELGMLWWLVALVIAVALAAVVAVLVAAYAVGRPCPAPVPQPEETPAERIPVVYDCDVAMGHPFRDVGDGLALLYLLGEPRVELLGVTTTYGNGPVRMTTRAARCLLREVGRENVPVRAGAAGPDGEPTKNEAARFLVDTANARPGEVVVIATGSMTNLRHAAALDRDFFKRLRGLYLLGGATGPLTWNGRCLGERNFALDPEAAYQAIHADCPVVIATAEAGLTAIFRSPQFAMLQASCDPVSRLIARRVRFWFALMRLYFRDDGFGMWDSVAVAAARPELFEYQQAFISSQREDLQMGRLVVDPSRHGPVRIVRGVRDLDGFVLAHLAAWRRLGGMRGGA